MSKPTNISDILEIIIQELNEKIKLVNKSIVKTEIEIANRQLYLWTTKPISIPWTLKYQSRN